MQEHLLCFNLNNNEYQVFSSLVETSSYGQWQISGVDSVEEFTDLIQRINPAVVVIDGYSFEHHLNSFMHIIRVNTNVAFIVLYVERRIDALHAALNAGAQDCIFLEEVTVERLQLALDMALIRAEVRHREISYQEDEGDNEQIDGIKARDEFQAMVTSSIIGLQGSKIDTSQIPLVLVLVKFQDVDKIGTTFGEETLPLFWSLVINRITECNIERGSLGRWSDSTLALLYQAKRGIAADESTMKTLIRKLDEPYNLIQSEVRMSFAIGACRYTKQIISTEEFFKGAETALRRSQRKNNPSYTFYSQQLMNKAQEKFFLSGALQNAINKDLLTLYFQPIVVGGTRIVTGAEVLLRWQQADGTWVEPRQIIQMAASLNLSRELGLWVLEHSLKMLQDIHQRGRPHFKLAINVSAQQLCASEFSAQVAELLEKYHCPSDCVLFEMKEDDITDDMQTGMDNLNALCSMGIGLGIDDFGTGKSSLQHLSKLPVSCLKIDRSFIADLPNSNQDQTVVKAIIGLAHNLKVKVIAEGIENSEQLNFISLYLNMDDEMQGYHFSQPLKASDFFRYLNQGF